MKSMKMYIPDMESVHCQLRVRGALESVEGLTIDSIAPGTAFVTIATEAQYQAALAAVEQAGYTVDKSDAAKDTDDTLLFRTNINCGGCIAAVTPFLDQAAGAGHWTVDTATGDKLLTVRATGITNQDIITSVERAGFRIEPVQH